VRTSGYAQLESPAFISAETDFCPGLNPKGFTSKWNTDPSCFAEDRPDEGSGNIFSQQALRSVTVVGSVFVSTITLLAVHQSQFFRYRPYEPRDQEIGQVADVIVKILHGVAKDEPLFRLGILNNGGIGDF
jgi:hypothetical protein